MIRHWTRRQDRLLRKLARKKWPSWRIADRLNRSDGAVRFRACTMNPPVKFRSIRRAK